jgi:23S rRNA (adenine2503-C2)-methyltransferase
VLDAYHVGSTVRVRRGIDIQAGCGQLKAELIRRGKTGK